MCYYRLYIFNGCGHSTVSETPVRYCKDARTKTSSSQNTAGPSVNAEGSASNMRSRSSSKAARSTTTKPRESALTTTASDQQASTTPITRSQAQAASGVLQPCGEGRVHPFHCIRLDRVCPVCVEEREERLRNLEREIKEIRFDPAKWHWKYQGSEGKDGKDAGAGWGIGSWWSRKGGDGAASWKCVVSG
jgi:hypothetical protein